MDFLGSATPPTSLELKAAVYASGTLTVCGIANENRFFVGYLYRTSDGRKFNVKHVTDAASVETTYDVSIRHLCGL